MRNFIFALLLGVLIGWGISRWRQHDEKPVDLSSTSAEARVVEEPVIVEPPVVKPLQKLVLKKGPLIVVTKNGKVDSVPGPQVNTEEVPVEEPSPAIHTLNFSVSEAQVALMEDRFTELSRAVSLYRDREGWVVRFQDGTNLLADAGIRDNDLIRFDEVRAMKQNPQTAPLMSRLENILVNLER